MAPTVVTWCEHPGSELHGPRWASVSLSEKGSMAPAVKAEATDVVGEWEREEMGLWEGAPPTPKTRWGSRDSKVGGRHGFSASLSMNDVTSLVMKGGCGQHGP